MGNNESLPPPPPPPGGEHHVPPPPPPPSGGPLQPPHVTPPPPPMPPGGGGAPKSNRTLIIGGAVAAVIAIVVVVVIATSGSDSSTPTLGGGSTPTTVKSLDTAVTSAVSAGVTTAAPTTSAAPQTTSEPTLVITTPSTNEPVATTAPATTTPADVQVVTDSTKSFKVTLPKQFDTQVTPIDSNGISFAHVSGSKDLQKYLVSDDVFGISILGATTDKVATPEAFLQLIKPSPGACAKKVTETITTSFGRTLVDRYDGCGTGGKFAKVIMAAAVKGQNAVVLAFCQGPAPSDGELFTFAKIVFETVTPL